MNKSNILCALQIQNEALDKELIEARKECERLFYGSDYEAMACRRNEFKEMYAFAFANRKVKSWRQLKKSERISVNVHEMIYTLQKIAAWKELLSELTSKEQENEHR
jgi:aminopeptidase C